MSTSKHRRQILINEMERLKGQGINCQNCLGICCTSSSNSMLITPVEANDIKDFLKSKSRWNEELKKKLEDCVKKYRLDYEIPTTRGLSFRRTYTCPFFEPGPKGCTIELENKPYGCLAFNPKIQKSSGGTCSSNKEILEQLALEDETKKSIPIALLDIWDNS